MKKIKSKNILLLLVLIGNLGLVISNPVYSQNKTKPIKITGTVVNEQGEMIKGAIVLIEKTVSGTVSDLSGNFSIQVPSLPTTLLISFIGYDSKEIEVEEFKTPIEITLSQTKKTSPKINEELPIYQVLDSVDDLPQPVDGREEWHNYIARTIRYPTNDRKAGIQGVVVVGFTISTKGKVQEAKILRGIGGESDQEVIRVISDSPDWIPAKQNGQPVEARMRVPILFRMNAESPDELTKRLKDKAVAEDYGKHFVVVGYSSPSSSK
jgi:TonB family protein